MNKLLYGLTAAVIILGGVWFFTKESQPKQNRPGTTVVVKPSSTATPTQTSTPTPSNKKGVIVQSVDFMAQAPSGNWSDPRQQDACEEASVIMAMNWVKGLRVASIAESEKQITTLADWQRTKYGSYVDTSTHDTVDRIFNDYFSYDNVRVEENVGADDIITELENGNLVIVMANGQLLGNRFFTAPGPERHALLIIGYDYDKSQFITNDPGTRSGANYRYSKSVLIGAVRDYPTGDHEPITSIKKNMIVVEK